MEMIMAISAPQDWQLRPDLNKRVKETDSKGINPVPNYLLDIIKGILHQSLATQTTDSVSAVMNYGMKQRLIQYLTVAFQYSTIAVVSGGKLLWRKFQRPGNEVNSPSGSEAIENETPQQVRDIMHNIACEMSCSTEDFENRTINVLKLLGTYSWYAKLVLILGAYSINYGQLRLIIEQCKKNDNDISFVNYVALLKHISSEDSENRLKTAEKLMESVADIIDRTLSVTLGKSTHYVAYWTIYAIVISCSIVTSISKGHKATDNTDELVKVGKIIENIQLHLKKLHPNRVPPRRLEDILKDKEKKNNKDLLEKLIGLDENITLIYGNKKEKVEKSVSSLQEKKVMFLISSFSIKAYEEEISFLYKFYKDTHDQEKYEILWLPVVDRCDTITEKEYDDLTFDMPWHVITYNSLQVDLEVVNHAKKEWGFNETPILVVFDEKGNLVKQDAFHMIKIWRKLALPYFTLQTKDENTLLKQIESYGSQFFFKEIDISPANKGDYVLFCGGDDIKWLNGLIAQVSKIKSANNINIEMVHIGKNTHKTLFEETRSKLSDAANGIDPLLKIEDYDIATQFWARLQSIVLYLNSSRETNTFTSNLDLVRKGATSLIAFDSSSLKWVAMGKAGSNNMVISEGEKFLESLGSIENIEKDKGGEIVTKIDNSLKSRKLAMTDGKACEEKHCIQVVLIGDSGKISGGDMCCAVCSRKMKKMVLFKCCKECSNLCFTHVTVDFCIFHVIMYVFACLCVLFYFICLYAICFEK